MNMLRVSLSRHNILESVIISKANEMNIHRIYRIILPSATNEQGWARPKKIQRSPQSDTRDIEQVKHLESAGPVSIELLENFLCSLEVRITKELEVINHPFT
jgi:hypothetical protein